MIHEICGGAFARLVRPKRGQLFERVTTAETQLRTPQTDWKLISKPDTERDELRRNPSMTLAI